MRGLEAPLERRCYGYGLGPGTAVASLTVRGSRDSSPGSTPILGLDSTPIQYLQLGLNSTSKISK